MRPVAVFRGLAAAGVGALASSILMGMLATVEGFWARQRLVPARPVEVAPPTGTYGGEYSGEPIELALLGDSLAAGVGAEDPNTTVGVLLAHGLASAAQRSVRLRNVARSGSESKELAGQIGRLVGGDVPPTVAVVIVGGNEIMHLQRIGTAVQHLSEAVQELRDLGCQVVVATCPDMGTVRPFNQPLRFIAHWLSRLLATAQTIVVLRSGGRTLSLADTLGPLFRHEPQLMFSTDHLHPSSQGYARAAEVLLPSVCAAAGYRTSKDFTVPHRIYSKDGGPRLAWLAFRAVRNAGVEIALEHHRGERLVEVGRRTLGRLSRRRVS